MLPFTFIYFIIVSISLASAAPVELLPQTTSGTLVSWTEPDVLALTPSPTDDGLLPLQSVIKAMMTATLVPDITASSIRTVSTLPPLHVPSIFPQQITPVAEAENPSKTDASAPEPKIDRKHTFIIMGAVVACIGGLAISAIICRMLVASGACGWGRGRAFHLDSAEKDSPTWQRLESPPPEKPLIRATTLPGVIEIKRQEQEYQVPLILQNNLLENKPIVWTRNSIPPYNLAPLLSPEAFFRQLDEEEQLTATSARSSRIRTSYASTNVSHHHGRAKSAPSIVRERHRSAKSNKSAKSTCESEWDIAGAYGGPRSDKALSTGAMSGVSVYSKDWEEQIEGFKPIVN